MDSCGAGRWHRWEVVDRDFKVHVCQTVLRRRHDDALATLIPSGRRPRLEGESLRSEGTRKMTCKFNALSAVDSYVQPC